MDDSIRLGKSVMSVKSFFARSSAASGMMAGMELGAARPALSVPFDVQSISPSVELVVLKEGKIHSDITNDGEDSVGECKWQYGGYDDDDVLMAMMLVMLMMMM